MATTLFKVTRSSADVGTPRVAPAPSGGTYVASDDGTSGPGTYVHLARINSDGTVNWQKKLSLSSSPSLTTFLASSTTHVAVALIYTDPDTSTQSVGVQLYDSAGSLVWHKAYEFELYDNDCFTMTPAGSDVYMVGQVSGSETMLVKLDGTTGNQSWTVNLRGSTESSTDDGSGPITFLSGGDLVLFTLGPNHTDATARAYIQRCSPSTGAVVWSKSVAWPVSTFSYTGLAVDASDNIYAWGRQFVNPTYYQIPVVKLDSSGAPLWNRQTKVPTGMRSHAFEAAWTGRGVAGTDGVLIPVGFGIDGVGGAARGGFVNIPAAGTVATSNVNLATFNALSGTSPAPVLSYGGTGQQILFCYPDLQTDEAAVVGLGGYAASEDAVFGSYVRTTFAYDLEAGTATVATATFTRASAVTVVAGSARTITTAAGEYTVTTYVPSLSGTATGKASGLAFGLPYVFGLVTPIASTAAFGTAAVRLAQPATGLASTLAFGTASFITKANATGSLFSTSFGLPVVNLNLSYAASTIDPLTAFGETWAWPGLAPAAKAASSIAPTTAFGAAVALPVYAAAASGFTSTAFGAPTHSRGQAATGLAASSAVGTPTLLTSRGATGFSTTAFGLAQVGAVGWPQGFAVNLRFGLPVANYSNRPTASGASATVFGTPSIIASVQRARSAKFRAVFGIAQAERTAP